MNGLKAPLLVFGEDWGAHPSSTQHIIKRLALHRETLWVNSIGLRRPRVTRTDVLRAGRKLAAMTWGAATRGPDKCTDVDIRLINARSVSWPGSRIARRVNRRLIPSSLKSQMGNLSNGRPILWASLPTAIDAVGGCDERAVVYYAGDDFSSLVGVDHVPVKAMECELADRADLIIAASDRIAEKFDPGKTKTLLHGCDVELFGKKALPADQLPVTPLVAGFYGSISDWLDQGLLASVAEKLKDWTFVMVGPIQCDVSLLRQCRNIRFIGPQPHESLPGFVQHWSASLLPFKDTPQIRACNPLKLREYMASGTPIVSTAFPALCKYQDHVRIANDVSGFSNALVGAAHESTGKRLARQKSVAGESWCARAAEVDHWLSLLEA